MMGVVNVVILVLLVWTFTSFCWDGDDDITINCEDVTAYVGDKINLTCTVSYLIKGCFMKSYKFINTAAADDSTICREEIRSDQLSRVSCPYTANKAMTTRFKFYLQTNCGGKSTEFSVSITDFTINCEDVTAHVGDKITLSCTVYYPSHTCSVRIYKFINTEADDDPTICREVFRDPCIGMSSFSCPYTADKAMTTQFKFFVLTTCGAKETYFSVNTTEAVKVDTDGSNTLKEETSGLDKSSVAVIICLLCCFFIVIVALFLWMRRKNSRSPPDYNMSVSRPHDYNMAVCEHNTSEHLDGEAMLKETSVNVQIEKPCQCNCNHNITSS